MLHLRLTLGDDWAAGIATVGLSRSSESFRPFLPCVLALCLSLCAWHQWWQFSLVSHVLDLMWHFELSDQAFITYMLICLSIPVLYTRIPKFSSNSLTMLNGTMMPHHDSKISSILILPIIFFSYHFSFFWLGTNIESFSTQHTKRCCRYTYCCGPKSSLLAYWTCFVSVQAKRADNG